MLTSLLSLKTGFLSLNAVNILSRIILCCEELSCGVGCLVIFLDSIHYLPVASPSPICDKNMSIFPAMPKLSPG